MATWRCFGLFVGFFLRKDLKKKRVCSFQKKGVFLFRYCSDFKILVGRTLCFFLVLFIFILQRFDS